jgi:glucose-1-phosphate thymidylyltransferase
LTILGDEIYVDTKHSEMIRSFEGGGSECMIGVCETSDIEAVKKNYSVKTDKDGKVLDLVEKPQEPFNNLIGCGTYMFRPSVFEYIRKTPVSERSCRKELADTMKMMVKDGRVVKAFTLGGGYLNINYQQDLETAERMLGGKKGNK